MGTGDGLKLQNPAKLALVGPFAGKARADDHFDGAPLAGDAAGEPDLPVAAGADAADQFVIGHPRWRPGGRRGFARPRRTDLIPNSKHEVLGIHDRSGWL